MAKRKPRVFLVHWKPEEAEARAATLRKAGYVVGCEPVGPEVLRDLRREPPTAVVIDLSRLPSHGRDIGLGLRSFKSTRRVPLVFVDGPPEKVERIKRLLPDAVYTTWNRIRGSLGRAIAKPPAEPVVPRSAMDGYSGIEHSLTVAPLFEDVVQLFRASQTTYTPTLVVSPCGKTQA